MMNTFPFTSSHQHWILVDILRVPSAMQKAYEYEAQPELRRLFQNSQFEHLLEQSPVLFNISANSRVLSLWQQTLDWRSSAVVFSIPSTTSIERLTTHLLHLMTAQIHGKPMLFRCYNNAVWMHVADALSDRDIDTLLGPAVGLSWVDNNQLIHSVSRSPAMTELAATPYHLQSDIWNQWI